MKQYLPAKTKAKVVARKLEHETKAASRKHRLEAGSHGLPIVRMQTMCNHYPVINFVNLNKLFISLLETIRFSFFPSSSKNCWNFTSIFIICLTVVISGLW